MHFSTFLLAAIALCVTSASATCFNTGQNWGDHQRAKDQLADACKELRGTYKPGEKAGVCRNSAAGGVSYAFEIQNQLSRDAKVSQDECERNIGDQIDDCGHGGQITLSGIRFRYILYKRSRSMRLLLLTQIGAIRIKGLARHSNILGE